MKKNLTYFDENEMKDQGIKNERVKEYSTRELWKVLIYIYFNYNKEKNERNNIRCDAIRFDSMRASERALRLRMRIKKHNEMRIIN